MGLSACLYPDSALNLNRETTSPPCSRSSPATAFPLSKKSLLRLCL